VTKADALVEKGAARLQALSRRAAGSGGVKARLAPTLAEDATFLRKLKPSLMAARLRGEAPTDQEPGTTPAAPSGPQLGRRPNGNGPSPLVVVGAAFAVGIVLARLIDWRGHAHPRD
jgi:hypothetical protein